MPPTQLSDLRIDDLLEPVQDDSPTGTRLETNSFNSPLYAAKEARDEAERRETQYRNWQIETLDDEPKEKACWPPVIEKASDVLANVSKDLRAVAWLSEGLIRVYGVAGLKEALNFCVELTSRYWDTLHPGPDEEEGHTAAGSGLRKLFGELTVRALDDLCFVETSSEVPVGSPQRITFQQYRNVSEFDRITDQSKKLRRRERLGWVATEDYRRVAELTPAAHLRALHEDLSAAVELAYRFGAFLRENCRPDRYGESTSPDNEFRQFRGQVEWMCETVGKLIQDRGLGDSADQHAAEAPVDDAQPSGQSSALPAVTKRPGALATREDAFRAIEEIADFLEKQEPHSPVHCGLRQIVRWGGMSFSDLLQELLEDDKKMLASVRKRVGLPTEE